MNSTNFRKTLYIHSHEQQQSAPTSTLRRTNFGVNIDLKRQMLLNSNISSAARLLQSNSNYHQNSNTSNVSSIQFKIQQQQQPQQQQLQQLQSAIKLPEILPSALASLSPMRSSKQRIPSPIKTFRHPVAPHQKRSSSTGSLLLQLTNQSEESPSLSPAKRNFKVAESNNNSNNTSVLSFSRMVSMSPSKRPSEYISPSTQQMQSLAHLDSSPISSRTNFPSDDTGKIVLPLSISNAHLPQSFAQSLRQMKTQSSMLLLMDGAGQETQQANIKSIGNIKQWQEEMLKEVRKPKRIEDPLYNQTKEQKQFQMNLLESIRRKQNARSKSQQIFTTSVREDIIGLSEKKAEEATEHQAIDKVGANKSEHTETFRRALKAEVNKEGSLLRHHLGFLLPTVDVNVFVGVATVLFNEALSTITGTITGNGVADLAMQLGEHLPKKKWKIPRKILNELVSIWNRLAIISKADSSRFEYYVVSAQHDFGLTPDNLLEELGGVDRCRGLVVDFYKRLCSKWGIATTMNLSEKQIIEVGLAVLGNKEDAVEQFIMQTKHQLRVGVKELSGFKHFLVKFLFDDYNEYFDEDTKVTFISRYESIRYEHFLFGNDSMNLIDDISIDMSRIFLIRKGLLDYFEDHLRIERVQTFVLYLVDCLMYKKKPSEVAGWLRGNTKSYLDERFYFMLNSLIAETLKRMKMTQLFMMNARMKLFWIKMALIASGDNISNNSSMNNSSNSDVFDGKSVKKRLPMLLLNLNNWIENMIAMKQLGRLESADVKQTKFMQYFITSIFTEEVFSAEDIMYQLEEFAISVDAVLFQFKGIKRVMLLMRFNTNDAFAFTDFLVKTFNDALAGSSTNAQQEM